MNRKKKSPSRRKRDRDRFRKWLERKKIRKAQVLVNTATVSSPVASPVNTDSPSPARTSPPSPGPPEPVPNTTVSNATVASDPLESEQPAVSPVPVTPVSPTTERCRCKNCQEFNVDEEPYADLKIQCEFTLCDLTSADTELKTCTRCSLVAYCSKEHQREDWRLHKQVCDAEDGIEIRKTIEEWRRWKAEPHHHQHSS